jgi:hypothetical protein
MKAHVLHIARLNMQYAQANLADIPDDKMTALPPGLVNHPAWIVGHVVMAAEGAVQALGGQAACTDEAAALFGEPPAAGAGPFPGKQELLAALTDCYARLEKAFEAASDELLAMPLPDEEMRPFFPTVGDMAVGVMTIHPALHFGQLAAWRTAMGMALPI